MSVKELIIGIHNQRVYFNPEISIPIESTNIPKESFIRHRNKYFLWKVMQLKYSSNDNSLLVKLIEYDSDNNDAFYQQQPKKDKSIEKLIFENADWSDLGIVLSGYSKINARDAALGNTTSGLLSYETTEFLFNRKHQPAQKEIVRNITSKQIEEHFWIDISEIEFKLGYVTFKKQLKEIGTIVEFKIINEHLLAEFENVKFWFAKILKTKKIKVLATVTLRGTTIIDTKATSVHIDKITPELIDSVKYQRTYGLTKPSKIKAIDKSLFTAEDIFDQFEADNSSGNAFQQTELDILALLSDKSSIRNKKQLAYLAGGKQTERQKLRYTLHPHFGFVFLIEGEMNNHFVWELLNSHATYIWSIGKSEQDITLQYKRIEACINTVRLNGRDEYKRSYKNNHIDEDLVFNVIEHDHADSDLKDGFLKWKNRLNEMLI